MMARSRMSAARSVSRLESRRLTSSQDGPEGISSSVYIRGPWIASAMVDKHQPRNAACLRKDLMAAAWILTVTRDQPLVWQEVRKESTSVRRIEEIGSSFLANQRRKCSVHRHRRLIVVT